MILWIPLGVILALILAMGVVLFQPQDGGEDPMIGRALPDLPLADFPGPTADYAPTQVEGPYLLNVWASWCAPCRIEHPLLMELAEQGVPIYGVAYKDDPANATAFLNQLGDPFAGLAADPEGRAAIELGLTGAPETFVIDAEGVIRARWRGAIDDLTWRRSLAPAWDAAGGTPVDAGVLPQVR
ncbi:MAG: DsbE family thiol:disulfide interchange protein [Oceanicaulis sp.]